MDLVTPYGFRMRYEDTGVSATTTRQIYAMGIYESDDLAAMRRLVGAGDHVVDVGAHEGFVSLFLASIVGRTGRVYSFEPNPENLVFLLQNQKLNPSARIEVHPSAVGMAKGTSRMYWHAGAGAMASLVPFEHLKGCESRVETETLDDALQHREQAIRFIKIDTEGYELEVVSGAVALIEKDRPVICFEVNLSLWAYRDRSLRELFRLFTDRGYGLYRFCRSRFEPLGMPRERVENAFALPDYSVR